MDKKIIIANLVQIANELDGKGEFDAANEITEALQKFAQQDFSSPMDNTQPIDNPQSSMSKEEAIGIVQNDGMAIQTLSPELQSDPDVAMTAIRNNLEAIQYVPQEIKDMIISQNPPAWGEE